MKKPQNKVVRPAPPTDFDDNPAWTSKDLARARPAREVIPGVVAAAKKRGRPLQGDRPKVSVSLRIDANVLLAYKQTGAGWQRLINKTLAKGVNKLRGDTSGAKTR